MADLTTKQRKLAELMVSEPNLSNEKYAKQIGIDPSTIYRWKKSDEFNEYVSALCHDRFKDLERLAIRKLREQVENGSWKAIQYVLDSLGYAPKQEIDIKSTDINISITGDADD